MAWTLLFIAGLFEIIWAVGLKYTRGFTRPLPTVITLIAMIASYIFLGLAARTLPIGTAYAVWTGIGIVGAFVIGIMALGEPVSAARILCVVLIVAGIAGLRMLSSG